MKNWAFSCKMSRKNQSIDEILHLDVPGMRDAPHKKGIEKLRFNHEPVAFQRPFAPPPRTWSHPTNGPGELEKHLLCWFGHQTS